MTPVEPPEYVVSRLREALAMDSRVNELDVQVQIAGGKVFLSGTVTTPERQHAVTEVAREVLPEWEIHNGTVVADLSETPAAEQLP